MSTHTKISRIYLEPVSLSDRGQRYRVIHDGLTLIASSRNPEFDFARALLAKGITGQLEVWHNGAAFYAMRVDIAEAAGLTVEESDRIGPRFARWRPRSEETANAVSCSDHSSRTGADEIQVGKQHPTSGTWQKRPLPRQILSPSPKRLLPKDIAMHKCKPIPITHLPKRERPLCGARTRRGTDCQRRALDNGRCRNHGGLSTGPKTAAGRRRISEAQHRRWAEWRSCAQEPI